MKEKIDYLCFIKTKNLCSIKDYVKKMKRQATNQEKIFAKHLSDKGLVSKIYTEERKRRKTK